MTHQAAGRDDGSPHIGYAEVQMNPWRVAQRDDNLKALSNALEVTTDYLLGRVDNPQLVGGVADQLFRHAENMSSNDLDTLTSFAEMLATKAAEKKRG